MMMKKIIDTHGIEFDLVLEIQLKMLDEMRFCSQSKQTLGSQNK